MNNNVYTEPRVTIITVVLNAEDLIQKTIDSVIAQDYINKEYIVLDGCSEDATIGIINNNIDNINIFESAIDDGIYDAMNKGIRLATGDWLYYLNAGDVFSNEKVLSNFMKGATDEIQLIVGNIEIVDMHNKKKFILCP